MTLLAFALRVTGMLAFHTYHFSTQKSEHSTTPVEFSFGGETGSIAASLAEGQGFSSPFGHPTGPTAWIAPVYPTIVAGVFKVLGVYSKQAAIGILSLNSLFSSLVCLPVVFIGRRIFSNAEGLLAGWVWAVVPIYMKWPITWVWDTSLSALLLALLVLSTVKMTRSNSRTHWLGHGLLWGIAGLTNPALISVLPLSLAWLTVKRHRLQQSRISPLVTILVALIVCLVPWIVRNEIILGKPAFLRDNFWFEFHLGNYHLSNGMGWGGKHPTMNQIQLDFYSKVGEIAYIDHFRAEAIEFVKTYPGEFLGLTYTRIISFWGGNFGYMFETWWEWLEYTTLSALAVLGFVLALGNRKPGSLLFGTVLFCYPMVYYVVYPAARYRYAIEPEMLLLSSYFLCELVRNFRERFIGTASGETEEELLESQAAT
jgi:4-amino-4-deoxy-L-arabinose transferase-like glycosyltransferase